MILDRTWYFLMTDRIFVATSGTVHLVFFFPIRRSCGRPV